MRAGLVALSAALAALVVACGSPAHRAAPAPRPAASSATWGGDVTAPAAPTTAPPGPERFLAEVRKAGLGDRDLRPGYGQGRLILHIGSVICSYMDGGGGYQDALRLLISHHATTHQRAVWVDSAIRNLCPAHLSEMPVGAP